MIVSIGGVEIRFGEAIHPVPALVSRLDADGVSLTYSGDTGPGGDLIEMATGTDVLLCEASLVGIRDERTYPYHLTAREAGEIAAWGGVDRLILTHIGAVMDPPSRKLTELAYGFGPLNSAASTTIANGIIERLSIRPIGVSVTRRSSISQCACYHHRPRAARFAIDVRFVAHARRA